LSVYDLPDGKAYYTISEGTHPRLFYYNVPHTLTLRQ